MKKIISILLVASSCAFVTGCCSDGCCGGGCSDYVTATTSGCCGYSGGCCSSGYGW